MHPGEHCQRALSGSTLGALIGEYFQGHYLRVRVCEEMGASSDRRSQGRTRPGLEYKGRATPTCEKVPHLLDKQLRPTCVLLHVGTTAAHLRHQAPCMRLHPQSCLLRGLDLSKSWSVGRAPWSHAPSHWPLQTECLQAPPLQLYPPCAVSAGAERRSPAAVQPLAQLSERHRQPWGGHPGSGNHSLYHCPEDTTGLDRIPECRPFAASPRRAVGTGVSPCAGLHPYPIPPKARTESP